MNEIHEPTFISLTPESRAILMQWLTLPNHLPCGGEEAHAPEKVPESTPQPPKCPLFLVELHVPPEVASAPAGLIGPTRSAAGYILVSTTIEAEVASLPAEIQSLLPKVQQLVREHFGARGVTNSMEAPP